MSNDAATSRDVLDRPAWHALAGRQAELSVGDHRALRFAPEYGPFAAAVDNSIASLSALAGLAGGNELWLLEKDQEIVPPGCIVVRRAECLQMVASSVVPGTRNLAFEDLGHDDAQMMLALASLTVPGPFSTRTYRLGSFIGIKEGGHLVAMAGERMKPGNFTELSGVCTHPDHRGRGYAGFLMRVVASRILERGESPFLHCYASNAGAIALYESLGFERHQSITATILMAE